MAPDKNSKNKRSRQDNNSSDNNPGPPSTPPPSPSSQYKKPTQKARLTNKQAVENQRQREKKKDKERRCGEDSDEIRQLKEQLEAAQAEARVAMEKMANMDAVKEKAKQTVASESVKRPSNLSKITVRDIRRHLGLEGRDHDREWHRICSTLRRCFAAGRIDWSAGWKGQKLQRLGRIYDVVDKAFPPMRRFENQWATEFLAKEYFASHKTYDKCADDPNKIVVVPPLSNCDKEPSPDSDEGPRLVSPVASSSAVTLDGAPSAAALFDDDLDKLTENDDEDEEEEEEEEEEYTGKGKGKAKGGKGSTDR
ncbi:hypothetical protein V5O48_018504 [Marasmius crinis-equi]|uniref:Uncharacterized protein n=1 Tax=Marasmius crinis-equi TaxID=585013 RepID=A0ABR3EKZ7_9AGAR